MKLPISLLVLAVLGQALSVQLGTKKTDTKSLEPKTKTSPVKSSSTKSPLNKDSVPKQNDSNQTSKRELYEGNFGDRNTELSQKHEVTGAPPKIEYTEESQDGESEQSPTHQTFGSRLPQLVKISDVLSQQGTGSFEAAVAKHLYSPMSVYQTRPASPTTFEVPAPAASQSAYSNSKPYNLRKASDNEQNLQEVTPKAIELPNPPIPLYTVNQPRLHLEAYPQALDQGQPQEIYQPQYVPRNHMPALIPIYDQLGPFRHPGQVVPSQYLNQNRLYQIVPVRHGNGFGNQEGIPVKNSPNQENYDQSKSEPLRPHIQTPVHRQGYHAHPNGAISFASFSQNLPINKLYETAQSQQSETLHGPPQAQLQPQPVPLQLPAQIETQGVQQTQERKPQVKENHQFSHMFQRLIQDLQHYQPVFQERQPQFVPINQHIQNQPRPLNALQQHLLYQDPRQLSNPQVIELQRLPKFKPLPQTPLTSVTFLQQTSRPPVITGQPPRPFSLEYQSTPAPNNFLVEPASTPLTPLPPLKPNYSKFVKPLETHSHTTPGFLQTPLQSLSSSTPKEQLIADQLISSTTIQPTVKDQEDFQKQDESKPESQPLNPEISHQSEPTVRPPSIQSTTYLPFVTHEPQSIYFQYSTPQPQYQSTIRPESIKAPLRHDVVIQRQEIQELFFEPSPQQPSTAYYHNQRTQIAPQHERELLQLRSQPHHQLIEQLQPLPYQHEIQDINSQQYLLEARQSHSVQNPNLSQWRELQQYQIQQHSQPIQLLQFPPTLLQSLQPELNMSPQQEQQHQVTNSEQQQQHESEQRLQQQDSEQTQHQQGTEQTQQQQDRPEQSQQQQDASEQGQQQQYQEQNLDSNNQIQISTLKPSEDTERQTETVEIQQQPESQASTGKPNEQPGPSSEPTASLDEPYLGPLLNPSVLPQIYAPQKQLIAQPEYNPLLGVPPYSDVQYFGKFAESLFGNHHH